MKLSSLIVLASGALGAPAPAVQNKAPVVIQGKDFWNWIGVRPWSALLSPSVANVCQNNLHRVKSKFLKGQTSFRPPPAMLINAVHKVCWNSFHSFFTQRFRKSMKKSMNCSWEKSDSRLLISTVKTIWARKWSLIIWPYNCLIDDLSVTK